MEGEDWLREMLAPERKDAPIRIARSSRAQKYKNVRREYSLFVDRVLSFMNRVVVSTCKASAGTCPAA
jgi:hypothetical protein